MTHEGLVRDLGLQSFLIVMSEIRGKIETLLELRLIGYWHCLGTSLYLARVVVKKIGSN